MSLTLSQFQTQSRVQKLTHEQKLLLRQILEQRIELQTFRAPDAKRGIHGLKVADDILKSKQSAGILIGGLSETVWSQQRKPLQLAKRKDVDVLVINEEFELNEKFEGGIDWWLPNTEYLKVTYENSTVEGNVKWWQNGFDTVLRFGMEERINLSPGLHFLGREDILEMRWLEATSQLSETGVELEGDILEIESGFKKRLERNVKLQMPKYLRDFFKGQIHYEPYLADDTQLDPVDITSLDSSQISSINDYLKSKDSSGNQSSDPTNLGWLFS